MPRSWSAASRASITRSIVSLYASLMLPIHVEGSVIFGQVSFSYLLSEAACLYIIRWHVTQTQCHIRQSKHVIGHMNSSLDEKLQKTSILKTRCT